MAAPPVFVLGIDVGSSRCVAALADAGASSFSAELVQNESSSVSTPSCVAFSAQRLFSDAAVSQLGTNAASTIATLLPLLGETSCEAAAAADAFARLRFEPSAAGSSVAVVVNYEGQERRFLGAQLAASLIKSVAAQAVVGSGALRRCVLTVPACFTAAQSRALLDAALIAGLPQPTLVPSHAAAASCWGVKHPLGEESPPKRVSFVDVGHRYTGAAVYLFSHRAAPQLLHASGLTLGAADLDGALWEHAALQLQTAHGVAVAKASRPGFRLLAEVSKCKRTLSTLQHASIDLECFGPQEKDYKLKVTREAFEHACAPLQARLASFLAELFAAAGPLGVACCEVVGGGARVPWVSAAIALAAGAAPVCHTLDSASCGALGAAFIGQAHPDDRPFPWAAPPPVVAVSGNGLGDTAPGLDAAQLDACRAEEAAMSAADAAAAALADAWNAFEAYILETRSAATDGPLARHLAPEAVLPLLQAEEQWMVEVHDDGGPPVALAVVSGRLEALRSAVLGHAPAYFAQLAAQKAELEVCAPSHARAALRCAALRCAALPSEKCTHRTSHGSRP